MEGRMFCPHCGIANDDEGEFCAKCGRRLARSPNITPPDERIRGPGPVVPSGQMRYATGKNPTTAVILSLLFSGVGQFYNGDHKKGALMLVGAIVLAVVTGGWWGVLPVAIWSIYDAYQVASGKSALW
jgi:TM2 domain-containing membrane protein YozV